jgi:hypothetical protein
VGLTCGEEGSIGGMGGGVALWLGVFEMFGLSTSLNKNRINPPC